MCFYDGISAITFQISKLTVDELANLNVWKPDNFSSRAVSASPSDRKNLLKILSIEFWLKFGLSLVKFITHSLNTQQSDKRGDHFAFFTNNNGSSSLPFTQDKLTKLSKKWKNNF